jgi:uncharacterized protein (TIGR03437 family)
VDGEAVRFRVSGYDPNDHPIALSAPQLPAGASFDPDLGEFSWEPLGTETGSYPISFVATNGIGESATATVVVEVMSGDPVLRRLIQAATRSNERACSPGSLVTVQGAALHKRSPVEDVKVTVNGDFVPVVEASADEITFQCPDLPSGTRLTIQAHRGERLSNPLETLMVEASPGVFSLDRTGSGQGMVLLDESRQLAMFRSPHLASQPATIHDRISVLATGLGSNVPLEHVRIGIGETVVGAESVTALAPGFWQVVVRTPEDAATGESVSLRLLLDLADGRRLVSNLVTIAIEASSDSNRP